VKPKALADTLPTRVRTTIPPQYGRNAAAAKLLRELTQDKDDLAVRYYEEDGSGKREELYDEDEFTKSFNGLGDLEKELAFDPKQLLEEIKRDLPLKGVVTDQELETIINELGGKLQNASDGNSLASKLDSYIKELEDELDNEGDIEHFIKSNGQSQPQKFNPIPQIPEHAWSINQRKRISRLNVLLERTVRESRRGQPMTTKTILLVWKSYQAARQSLAHAWGQVPADVWNLLWSIFAAEDAENPSRLLHISLLARDMSEAKVPLAASQQLLTIESMFVNGWETKAIDNWKRCIPALGDEGASTFKQFWELGVRMFCQLRDLAQAERAVSKVLLQQADPRILMPYIRSCAEQGSDEGLMKSWDSYRHLRDLLGTSMTLEDYDQVVSYFLASNQTEYALYAFVDMMTAGNIDLKGKHQLPTVIANKFFFGKWLKRLIGAGDLNGAHNVVKFMHSKGIRAAPIQLNGLIGAWQRSGATDNLQKADSMAWDMVKSRIDFVRSRQRLTSVAGPLRLVSVDSTPDTHTLPAATLETFSLLAENYRLRRLHDRMEELWDAFQEAEISPDAFMMNQLMESYSQFGNIQEAQNLYRSLVVDRGIKPDPYTFMALWKMLGVNRLHVVPEHQSNSEVSAARETFSEMVKFASIFKQEGLDGQLARKILHTFRRLDDKLGLVVALRGLKDVFGFLPPELLVLELLMGTTNLAWDAPKHRQRLRQTKRELDVKVAEILQSLGQKGVSLDSMTAEQRGEVLCEYLESYFAGGLFIGNDKHDTIHALRQVAEEMGVSETTALKAVKPL
jgi:hypothetical protein